MKKDCAYTRTMLRRYLRGHLFKTEQVRIERHLKQCALCSSELQAIRLSADTQKLLKDITPPEGVVQRVKEGVFGLSRLKRLLYRPLWIIVAAVVIAALYYYVFIPYRYLLEGDRWEGDIPPAATAPQPAPPASGGLSVPHPGTPAAAPQQTPGPAASPSGQPQAAPALAAPAAPREVLEVTISVVNEKAAMRRINDVMQGHALLRTMQFTDTTKEIAGNLTAKELLTFFGRIEDVGKIRYNQSRLESFPTAQPIPFVLRLKLAPRPPSPPVSQPPAGKPVDNPVQKPVQNPVQTTGEKPVERAGEKPEVPAQPAP